MDDLVRFLLDRIAEDEDAARAASAGGRWRYSDGDSVGAWTLYDEHWRIADLVLYRRGEYDYEERMPAFRPPYYVDADANGSHIARHDPARVLAECEAKRRILELHPTHEQLPYRAVGGEMYRPPDPYYCDCQCPDGIIYGKEPCDTKRFLALPYADHPSYRQEWAP